VTAAVADDEFACLGNLVAIAISRKGRTNSQYGKQALS
jgi:hypothetical protein